MEPSPEARAFAQPLAPAEVLAAPGPAASLEEEAAAAEAAPGEALAVAAALAVPVIVSSPAARVEYSAARAGLDFLLAHPERLVAAWLEVAGD